ncbi:MAG: hypothetical protein FRX48_07676 [Lasallia pustulata]|uniref:Uncharacterized protein n=1 Tax=Lasallia pustulata TaxID=136370 RepID=A0A5M8PIH6_9LECA|nr:MAG: hypothetical protein FRX48_07676 [Lasallia pustulata]
MTAQQQDFEGSGLEVLYHGAFGSSLRPYPPLAIEAKLFNSGFASIKVHIALGSSRFRLVYILSLAYPVTKPLECA